MNNRLEIFGTLGPSCCDIPTLEQMFRAGMTGLRLNLSHTTLEEAEPMLFAMRQAAERCGITPDLLIDLQGPELRIGNVAMQLEAGKTVMLSDLCLPEALLCALAPGQELLLDDGTLSLVIRDAETALVTRGGMLLPHKSVAAPGRSVALPVLTAADRHHLSIAKRYGVTGIMQPFVRSRQDLLETRIELEACGCADLRLFAKIESLEGMQSLPQWMDLADVLVIARGDLGNSMPLWKLPGAQQCIEALAQQVGKPFLVVTQMLDSMRAQPVPTRAEVNDVFHAVLDGASAIMLTGETAAGQYPAEAMTYFCNTAREAVLFARALSEQAKG